MVRKYLSLFALEKDAMRVYDPLVDKNDKLLTPGEVAASMRVDPKTVTRWAAAGKIRSIRTPGGHRRFYAADVQDLLDGKEPPAK